jgi:hypothetical protein
MVFYCIFDFFRAPAPQMSSPLEFNNLPPEIRHMIHEFLPQVIFWDKVSRTYAKMVFNDWIWDHKLTKKAKWLRANYGQSFRQSYYFLKRFRPSRNKIIPKYIFDLPRSEPVKKYVPHLANRIILYPNGDAVITKVLDGQDVRFSSRGAEVVTLLEDLSVRPISEFGELSGSVNINCISRSNLFEYWYHFDFKPAGPNHIHPRADIPWPQVLRALTFWPIAWEKKACVINPF